MAASTDFINDELESKGITDITRDDAFHAWEGVAKCDTDHAVILRSLIFDVHEPLPVPILHYIARRRASTTVAKTSSAAADGAAGSESLTHMSGPELKACLDSKIPNAWSRCSSLRASTVSTLVPRWRTSAYIA